MNSKSGHGDLFLSLRSIYSQRMRIRNFYPLRATTTHRGDGGVRTELESPGRGPISFAHILIVVGIPWFYILFETINNAARPSSSWPVLRRRAFSHIHRMIQEDSLKLLHFHGPVPSLCLPLFFDSVVALFIRTYCYTHLLKLMEEREEFGMGATFGIDWNVSMRRRSDNLRRRRKLSSPWGKKLEEKKGEEGPWEHSRESNSINDELDDVMGTDTSRDRIIDNTIFFIIGNYPVVRCGILIPKLKRPEAGWGEELEGKDIKLNETLPTATGQRSLQWTAQIVSSLNSLQSNNFPLLSLSFLLPFLRPLYGATLD